MESFESRKSADFEFSKEYWITRQYTMIPGFIVSYIKSVTGSSNQHISKYFLRAFTRWMFNIIRKGKNPFHDIITADDLIIKEDLDYFFATRDVPRPVFDWTWLDQKLKYAICGFDPSRRVGSINVRVEAEIFSLKEISNVTFSPQKNFVFYDIEDATFKISKKQYNLALCRFRGQEIRGRRKSSLETNDKIEDVPQMFNEYLAILIARYISMGTTNNHCSVPPHVINFCNIKTELFGSPLNTNTEQYCSPMLDIEKYFGSLGSFFSYDMCSGTYLLNPPYDESIINIAMEKIFQVLNTQKEITVIIVLPIWDIETQVLVERKCKNVEFPIIPVIKDNKYTRSHCLLSCFTHRFYNYYIDDYLPLADTHLFVMSNTVYNLTAQQIAKFWEIGLGPMDDKLTKRNSW